jgi:hypothetical protein
MYQENYINVIDRLSLHSKWSEYDTGLAREEMVLSWRTSAIVHYRSLEQGKPAHYTIVLASTSDVEALWFGKPFVAQQSPWGNLLLKAC